MSAGLANKLRDRDWPLMAFARAYENGLFSTAGRYIQN
jgi:hypothetical protein